MKHNSWIHHLFCALLVFSLCVCALGNLITGYDLPVKSMGSILLWFALFVLGSYFLCRWHHGGKILLCIGILSLFILWNQDSLRLQSQSLSFLITSHYHAVYDWPILGMASESDVSYPLILWACLVSVGVNWHICRRGNILFAIIPVVLPLILCLMTNDRVPDTPYLYGMMLGLSLLLLTQWTRSHAPAQGTSLLFQTAIPVAAALALVFAWNPRDSYINHAGMLQKEAVSRIQDLLETKKPAASGLPVRASVSEKLNLKSVGPRHLVPHSVMRVNSPVGGILYLRGRDYDRYTGTGWEATSERNERFTASDSSSGKLTVVTYGVRDIRYIPYYANEEIDLHGGAMENPENLQYYSYSLSHTDSGNTPVPDTRYLDLPADTRRWATELLSEITNGSETEGEKISRIQSYIRDSAVYDLSTARMDSRYTDFAKWFLEESETGYCVHFATAATLLLRAAGIPARYVEGYMVSCSPGTDVVVSNREAHAWAEYYDSGSGAWRVLEATPGDHTDPATAPVATVPPAETAPDETEMQEPTVTPDDTGLPPNNSEKMPDLTEDTRSESSPPLWLSFPGWLIGLSGCLIFVLLIPIQAKLRISYKATLWNRGNTNDMAIARWKQTQKEAGILKMPYPENLDTLAQKAKFSQHRILPKELEQFDEFRLGITVQLSWMPWYIRVIYLWIFAIE